MMCGHGYAILCVAALAGAATRPTESEAPARWPEIQWTVLGMSDALVQTTQNFDFIHLSNILDWLAPEEAGSVLERAWKALRPGGWVFIRQLNSNLDLPSLGGRFQWLETSADALLKQDRSFFYRRLHLATKQ